MESGDRVLNKHKHEGTYQIWLLKVNLDTIEPGTHTLA